MRGILPSDFKAVVVGGGTGAPVSIRTLLSMGVQTSAVVAMADDGGSTGILRQEADVTPPGDIRKCLAAFARNPQDPFTRAFRYRFEMARNHTLGNLMLAALEDATGSFPEAVSVCERLLDVRGHTYPSTLERVSLVARTRSGELIEGQANACHYGEALESVWLTAREHPEAYEPAAQALREANLIVLGPGSLFTSIIPNLLVPGIVDAIRESHALVVFVCSLADVQGETKGLASSEHVKALLDHGMRGLVHCVFLDPNAAPGSNDVPRVRVSAEDIAAIDAMGVRPVVRSLADRNRPTWHDPSALRGVLFEVVSECLSPRA